MTRRCTAHIRHLAMLAAAAAPLFQAHAFDIKGISIGQRVTAQSVEDVFGVKCGNGAASMMVCNGSTTIANSPARLNLVAMDGTVVRMFFEVSPSDFDSIEAGLVGKFGEPKARTSQEVQNAMGAKFNDTRSVWQSPDDIWAVAHRYGLGLRTSVVWLSGPQDPYRARAKSASNPDL